MQNYIIKNVTLPIIYHSINYIILIDSDFLNQVICNIYLIYMLYKFQIYSLK